mmetsp:Transcript_17385/g.40898  ORF Transcript_17385/g.40898 Transcript_17385/m.40898 type:complete len:207 (-) Transcript_17385:132-752(-)
MTPTTSSRKAVRRYCMAIFFGLVTRSPCLSKYAVKNRRKRSARKKMSPVRDTTLSAEPFSTTPNATSIGIAIMEITTKEMMSQSQCCFHQVRGLITHDQRFKSRRSLIRLVTITHLTAFRSLIEAAPYRLFSSGLVSSAAARPGVTNEWLDGTVLRVREVSADRAVCAALESATPKTAAARKCMTARRRVLAFFICLTWEYFPIRF